jgi:hypothetical protein
MAYGLRGNTLEPVILTDCQMRKGSPASLTDGWVRGN